MTVFQFVCFDTPLPRPEFLSRWAPFASSFVARGIERLVLSERAGPEGFAYVSRNAWPGDRFEQAFGGQLPADAGGGPIRAIQGGAFLLTASAGFNPLVARTDSPKVVAFLQGASAIAPWRSLASSLPQDAGWALYEKAPATRGGRFDAVFELFAPPSPRLTALGGRPMAEVLALPEH